CLATRPREPARPRPLSRDVKPHRAGMCPLPAATYLHQGANLAPPLYEGGALPAELCRRVRDGRARTGDLRVAARRADHSAPHPFESATLHFRRSTPVTVSAT